MAPSVKSIPYTHTLVFWQNLRVMPIALQETPSEEQASTLHMPHCQWPSHTWPT